MRFRRFFFRLGVAAFLGASPCIAHAGPTDVNLERAKKLFARAETLEIKGEWARALDVLMQTAAITMTPGIRYHIAYCQEHMGRLVDASRNYALAQREARASRGSAARGVLALADQRFNEVAARIPHVTLSVQPSLSPDKVNVLVDRRQATVLPSGTFEIDPGEHNVEISAPGFALVRLPLSMVEKELREVDVALVPVAQVASGATVERAVRTVSPPPAQAKVRVDAIVTTSAAALLAGVGVGAYALASTSHDDGRVACAGQTGSCDDLKGSVRTLDAVALGAWVGAAALGITATVLWLKPRASATEARVSVGPGHIAVGYAF